MYDATLGHRLQHAIDNKTKPLGALGKIEALALRLGAILGSETPALAQPHMLVCAADHVLAARRVSSFPSDVTWQMVENFLAAGAAVSVLARQHGLALTVADCGVRREVAARPGLVVRRVAAGTADASVGPARRIAQCDEAVPNGMNILRALPGSALLLGEMGIGNSSVAAMLLTRLVEHDNKACTGAGTGLDADGQARKMRVLRELMALHAAAIAPLDALAAFGGFAVAMWSSRCFGRPRYDA